MSIAPAFLIDNWVLSATVTGTQDTVLMLDFARDLYASGGVDSDEPDLANLLDYRPTRRFRTRNFSNSMQVTLDFGQDRPVDLVGVLGCNAGHIILELLDSTDTVIRSDIITPAAGVTDHLLTLPLTGSPAASIEARSLRITAYDPQLDYIEVGALIAGPVVTLDKGMSWGWNNTYRDTSDVARTGRAGVSVSGDRPWRDVSIPLDFVSDANASNLLARMGLENGRRIPVLWLKDFNRDAVTYEGDWLYGLIADVIDLGQAAAIFDAEGEIWQSRVQLTQLPSDAGSGLVDAVLSIAVDPTSIDFTPGSAVVFQGAFADETVNIAAAAVNTGTISGSISIAGSDYTVIGNSSFSLAPGEDIDVTVRFAPSQAGDRTGTLSVQHDAQNRTSPISVSLTGEGAGAPVYYVFSEADKDASLVLSEGNLKATATATVADTASALVRVQPGKASGAWYLEFTDIAGVDASGFGSHMIGLTLVSVSTAVNVGFLTRGYGYSCNGSKYNSNAGASYGDTWTDSDVIGMAVSVVAGVMKVWFAKNGTWQDSGDPAAGTGEAFSATLAAGEAIYPALSLRGSADVAKINCGQNSFTYTAPTGFKAGFGDNF
ncbi:hypothetical protein [Oceanibaculum indicum]|uniref:B30.2/SPRY domain-containing protein n=1 Tax=Oceanibaculum indicum TaxID=526216 RepID=A0A420WGJ3_9PROT|nr:hypothetical protein [Oceanibaculum indicum]RKQ70111.1 hypothetical protein BCL74_2050 [Oceanibaculum indicum]